MKKCKIHHNEVRSSTPNDKTNRTELIEQVNILGNSKEKISESLWVN